MLSLSKHEGFTALQKRHDHLFEIGLDRLADGRGAGDDHDRDQAGNDRVFDRGRPLPVPEERAQSRSRSIGKSGKSAGGIA